eukprot:g14804.t1
MYDFWEALIGRISTTAGGLVKSQWAGVKNFQNQLFTLVSLMVFAYSLHQVKTLGLQPIHCKATLSLLTIYDVVRNQYFYLGEQILDDIPAAANFVVGTFIIVEMADQGNEGLTYGLFTTVSNLGSPFSRAIGNQIFGLFQPNLSDSANYKLDTMQFRHTVAASFLLSYAFSFASFLLLVLLPSQKQDAQRRTLWAGVCCLFGKPFSLESKGYHDDTNASTDLTSTTQRHSLPHCALHYQHRTAG